MSELLLIVSGLTAIAVIIAVLIGQARESAKVVELTEALIQSASQTETTVVDFDSFSELPPPVARYFRHVLTDGQKLIKMVRMHQSGMLRTSAANEKWSAFTAQQVVVPPATGFIWNAKVEMPFATHVRVLDSYSAGAGSGRVSILSAFPVASETGVPELNPA